MNESENLVRQLELLNQNISELVASIRELIEIERTKKATKKKSSSSELRLSDEERKELKGKFESLYSEWSSGNEFDVKRSLEEMDASSLRRLADAANVSQDRKASKDKILRLIVTRFREKKMLDEGITRTSSTTRTV